MNKIISFVLLCALLLMCFSGCSTLGDMDIGSNENNVQNSNDGNNLQDNTNKSNDDSNSTDNINNENNVNHIIVGTEPSSEPMSQYAISVKISEKYELSETGIPISVSYGLLDGTSNTDSYTDIVLRAKNEDGHMIILKKFNIEEILKSDYAVNRLWDNNRKWIVGLDYSCTESFMLPLSFFSGDSGLISIRLYECNSTDFYEWTLGAGAHVTLYYIRDDTNISISIEFISTGIQGS